MTTGHQHIFISYSRSDSQFAHQLATDLRQRELPVWIDTGGLTPGTPDWEQAIRDAIGRSVAVILIASPSSRQSAFVQGELAVARSANCPIYPVWAVGDQWVESIPLGMVNYQYVDCRADMYATGLAQIVNSLEAFVQHPELLLEIAVPSYEVIRLNPNTFPQLQELLNYLYANYLIDWYEPLTYGNEWVMVNLETKRIAVPWKWITIPNVDKASLFRVDHNWATGSPESYGFVSGSRWGVWEAARVQSVGFATNREEIEKRLLSSYGSRDLMLLANQCLEKETPSEVRLEQYKIHRVMAVFGSIYNRVAFVDTGKDCGV